MIIVEARARFEGRQYISVGEYTADAVIGEVVGEVIATIRNQGILDIGRLSVRVEFYEGKKNAKAA